MKYLVLLQAGGSGIGSLNLVDQPNPKLRVLLHAQGRYTVPENAAAVLGAFWCSSHEKHSFL